MLRTIARGVLASAWLLIGCGGGVDVGSGDEPDVATADARPVDGGALDAREASADTAPRDATLDAPADVPDVAPDPAPDARPDATLDTGSDASPDAAADVEIDVGSDAAPDAVDALEDGAEVADSAPDSPDATILDCSGTPRAVDPPSTLDPLADGPLGVARGSYVVPKLGPLADVNVAVWYPTNADGTPHDGRHAWIMFHHAVHDPSVIYQDYDKLFHRWASHGFVIFSIDGARIYYPPPSGAWTSLTWDQQQTVASLIDQGIGHFAAAQTLSTFDLACRLDLDRVAVAGHSRGGGAALLVPTSGRIDGATIKAYVGFQGVDPEALSPPPGYAIPGFDLPALYLDAALDGDVSYPIVALEYSRARAPATLVTILGSKHTFTLDDPLPDQGGATPTITPDEHKAVCNQYGISFLRANVRDATPDPSDVARVSGAAGMTTTASSGNVTLRWRPSNGAPSWLALLDWATGATTGATIGGDPITVGGSMKATGFETYAGSVGGGGEAAISARIHAVELQWDTTGGALTIPLPAGALAGKSAVVFDTANPDAMTTSGTSPLSIELDDSAGGKATLDVDAATGPGWKLRPKRLSVAYAPLASFTGVDPSKATTIKLVAKGAAAGRSLVTAMRLE